MGTVPFFAKFFIKLKSNMLLLYPPQMAQKKKDKREKDQWDQSEAHKNRTLENHKILQNRRIWANFDKMLLKEG